MFENIVVNIQMIDRNIANWVIGGPMEATSPSLNLTSGSSRLENERFGREYVSELQEIIQE